MTVASAVNRKTFAGDDATTSFDTTPVKFFATSDLQVYITLDSTGVPTLKTEGTHYSISGGDEDAGAVGTVNLAGGSSPHGALLSGTTLTILRELPLTQGADFVQNDASNAEVAEAALDRLVMSQQRLDERITRSFTLPDGDISGAATELPIPVASTLIGWDDDGLALQNYSTGELSGTIVVSAFMETVLDDSSAATARATLGAAEDAAVVKLTGNQTIAGDKTFTGQASGFGIPVVKRKTADESVDTSTTLQDDDHLVFPIGANEEWVADYDLDVGTNLDAHGIFLAVTVPAGATMNVVASNAQFGGFGGNTRTTVSGEVLNFSTLSFDSNEAHFRVSLWVLNGATPGNATLQWSQATSNGSSLTLRKGSHMVAHRIS